MIHKHSNGCDGSRGGFLSASFCCKIEVRAEKLVSKKLINHFRSMVKRKVNKPCERKVMINEFVRQCVP